MYSVLIQNQKTIQVFREYYPIFLDLFCNNQIGCCRWVESGRTLETALPGLSELIEDKEEWRAIIVRMVELDEHDMQSHAMQPGNPYDFKENCVKGGVKLSESPIPLVRLTQMLGEVPAPMQTFTEEVKQDPHKAPRRIYVPNGVDEEEETIYRELMEKYQYDGHKPSDVIIVTFTCVAQKTDKNNARRVYQAEDSAKTDFVRRNFYSTNCRFVQYPYTKEGKMRKDADLFNFWNCVMLLASDNIDPSSLQAYRLYTVHVDFNKEVLAQTFQDKYDELKGCRNFVEESIRHDLEARMSEKHDKPKYRASITAEIRIPDDTNVSVDLTQFQLCPKSVGNEMRRWEGLRDMSEGALETIFRNQDRVLDESAARMRNLSDLPEESVTPLDKYEKLDMEAELSHTFDEILRSQNTISDTRNVTGERISSLAEEVKNFIVTRIPKPLALEAAGLLILTVILAIIPGAIIPREAWRDHWQGLLVIFLFGVFVLIACELMALAFIKHQLIKRMDKYNDAMEDNLAVLTQDMKFYSNFVSNIVSFARGKRFLRILEHKKFQMETEYELLQKHLDQIGIMMEQVEKWSKAFFVPVNRDRYLSGDYLPDIEIGPRENPLYTFDYNEEYVIPMNYTGDEIDSPFGFIERLIIEREELFKDAAMDD